MSELLDALKKNPVKPKPDDAAALRGVLVSAGKLQATQKWKAVELLRHWTDGKSFGGEKEGGVEVGTVVMGPLVLATYPKEPGPPCRGPARRFEIQAGRAGRLSGKRLRGGKGDPGKGKLIFTKANCIKCHKFGTEGEGHRPRPRPSGRKQL